MCYSVSCMSDDCTSVFEIGNFVTIETAKEVAAMACSSNGFKRVMVSACDPSGPVIIMRFFESEKVYIDSCCDDSCSPYDIKGGNSNDVCS